MTQIQAMADLVVAATHQPTDLFGEPIEAHPPWFKPEAFLRADFDPNVYPPPRPRRWGPCASSPSPPSSSM
ncbi:hypothetical protein GUJ93_ZPchr0002g23260 [Zizania palustris]|uniref:Uncharacterized protein n=1 Tax=Zizania palustris TaxID=103762 RepID=A0A8J5SPB0_ZIZPA|nr:hypothetical protein GUJ93_ZPchr0002g23260 [Zizania palustris]